MGLDDYLDLAVVIWTVISTLMFAYVAWYAWRRRRLIRQLRADPILGPQIEQILKEQAEKAKTDE